MAHSNHHTQPEHAEFSFRQLAEIFGTHIKTVARWHRMGIFRSQRRNRFHYVNYTTILTLITLGKRIDRAATVRNNLDPDYLLSDAEAANTKPLGEPRGLFLCPNFPAHIEADVALRRWAGQSIERIRDEMGLTGHAILGLEASFSEKLREAASDPEQRESLVTALATLGLQSA